MTEARRETQDQSEETRTFSSYLRSPGGIATMVGLAFILAKANERDVTDVAGDAQMAVFESLPRSGARVTGAPATETDGAFTYSFVQDLVASSRKGINVDRLIQDNPGSINRIWSFFPPRSHVCTVLPMVDAVECGKGSNEQPLSDCFVQNTRLKILVDCTTVLPSLREEAAMTYAQ